MQGTEYGAGGFAVPEPPRAENAMSENSQYTPAKRKGFPVFSIPALVMLALMIAVFVLEILFSIHHNNILRPLSGETVGLRFYEKLLNNKQFPDALENSFLFRAVQLGAAGMLAAGLCALYYAMRKSRVILTFACLWLIPACLPLMSTSVLFRGAWRADYSGTLTYLLTTVLQTASLFCFFGGLFAFLGVQKKGRVGGSPYIGLLIGVLAFLLSTLSSFGAGVMTSSAYGGRTLEILNVQNAVRNNQYSAGAAGSVLKVLIQVLAAVVPAVVLSILARKKSTKGRMTLAVLWVFLAFLTFGLLLFLLGGLGSMDNKIVGSTLSTLLLAVTGGALGGLFAYSFVHLLRRVPSFLFGLIAVILAASLSCVVAKYVYMAQLNLLDTAWPQVLMSVFDPRLVLIVVVLSFALRDYTEPKPASLVLALALLAGALLWGEFANAYIYTAHARGGFTPLSMYYYNLVNNASAADISAISEQYAEALMRSGVNSRILTGVGLLYSIPPLLLASGGALLLKRSLAAPKTLIRE